MRVVVVGDQDLRRELAGVGGDRIGREADGGVDADHGVASRGRESEEGGDEGTGGDGDGASGEG